MLPGIMERFTRWFWGWGLCAFFLLACQSGRSFPKETDRVLAGFRAGGLDEPILPVPKMAALDARRVALGRRLFNEPRLSHDDSISCASCHVLERGGVDGLPLSIGMGAAVGSVNTPTVFNAALNFRQFWDGRESSLEGQVEGPIHNPREMGSSFEEVIAKLGRDPSWVRQVRESYGEARFTAATIRDAMATYERSLVLPGSRFDQFLAGSEPGIDADEQRGYDLFKSYGCASCHQGANVGGNMFERIGVARDYFGDVPNPSSADLGRYNVTKREEDRYVFKVPSLRLVSLTAPYFHNGTVSTLAQAIRLMARYQLGRELSNGDVALIETFLGSLRGTSPGVTFASAP